MLKSVITWIKTCIKYVYNQLSRFKIFFERVLLLLTLSPSSLLKSVISACRKVGGRPDWSICIHWETFKNILRTSKNIKEHFSWTESLWRCWTWYMIINRVPVRLLSLESSKDHLSHPCHSENTIRVIVVVLANSWLNNHIFDIHRYHLRYHHVT